MKQGLIAKHVAEMNGYTPGEQPKFPDIIKLNTNENPFPPSPLVAEALASFDYEKLRKYPDPNGEAVRERIAEIHHTTIEHVFAGNGSDEVLALCTRAFVQDSGQIACFDPTYSLYETLAEIRNVPCKKVKLNDDFSWNEPPLDLSADLFFLTNPNAPTGIRYEKSVVKAFASRFSGVVLIDEAYADFAEDNLMDLAIAPQNENIIVSRTLSKSFSLAGLRFGYCVGPTNLIAAMYTIKDSYNLDGITQAVALAALKDIDYMRRNAKVIKFLRTQTSQELTKMGWRVIPSETNFIFASPPNRDGYKVFTYLHDRHIIVRYFGFAPEFIRITIGTENEMHTLLSAINEMETK